MHYNTLSEHFRSGGLLFIYIYIYIYIYYNLHIANNCRTAANQLNALIRLRKFLGSEEKKVLTKSYFYSNFNY